MRTGDTIARPYWRRLEGGRPLDVDIEVPASCPERCAVSVVLLTGCAAVEETPKPSKMNEAQRHERYEEMTGQASPEAVIAPNVPEGYKDSGAGVGYKFVDGTCDYGRCTHVELVTYTGCTNGVYVAANTVDSAGRAIGLTNDLLGSLRVGETGLVTLTSVEADAVGVELTDVKCY